MKFARKERQREMIDVPARWHQHSFGQRPIQRSPAPCGPRAGGLVWVFSSKTTSEVVSHVSQGFVACMWKMMILAWSVFWTLYKAASSSAVQLLASAHTPQHGWSKRFRYVLNESKLCQAATEQQESNGQRRESPSNCYFFQKKIVSHLTQMDHLHYLTLLLITSAIYFKNIIL